MARRALPLLILGTLVPLVVVVAAGLTAVWWVSGRHRAVEAEALVDQTRRSLARHAAADARGIDDVLAGIEADVRLGARWAAVALGEA